MAVNSLTLVLILGWTELVHSFYRAYNVSDKYSPLTAITMDNVTGNVYIGGRNIFMKLNENLELVKQLSMGPKMDNINCPPVPESCSEDRVLTDNDIKIVEINNRTDYILVCGTAWQGLCSAHLLNDISEERKLLHTMTTSYVGSRTSSVAFFGAMNSKWPSSDKLLYVAIGRDDRPAQFASAAVSVREIKNTGTSWEMTYFVHAETYHSYIDIGDAVVNTFKAYYIYGFEHDGYTYFISVQKKDPKEESGFITKIIQICQDDVSYASYSELPLQCSVDSKIYHLATAAYFATENNLEPAWDKKLFVTFGKNDNFSPNPDLREGSAMCVFDISSITAKFRVLHEDCFVNGYAKKVAWVYGTSLSNARPCSRNTNVELTKFCGGQPNIGIQDNPSYGERHVLSHRAMSSIEDGLLNSVSVITQHSKTIAILGTYDGYLLKVLVEQARYHKAYLKYDLTKDRSIKIERDMQLDKKEENLYVLTGSQVTKFPLYTCEAHSTCEDCVSSGDPLTCGWCGDRCTTQAECVKPPTGVSWSSDTCPPVIYKIMPTSGPAKGHTFLTIQGRNFGSSGVGVQLTVTINQMICKILDHSPNRIICTTPEVSIPGTFPVQLTVRDDTLGTQPYKIDGTLSYTQEPFMYKNPAIRSFTPMIGPVSGGSTITIYGENFDIGTNRSATVAYFPCAILSFNATVLKCQTARWSGRRRRQTSDSLADGPVEVTIDGGKTASQESFAYKEDATITEKSPERAIFSGGITITVKGTNLNVVANPQIRMSFSKDGRKFVTENCKTNKEGTQMLCPAPNITSLLDANQRREEVHLLYMSFIMDGIEDLRRLPYTYISISMFKYHPDPQFYKFTDKDNTRHFELATELLDVKGSKITLGITKKDVTVRIGNSYCNVTTLKEDVMYCKPMNKPSDVSSNEPKRMVEVKVGYLLYNIGYLVYVGKETSVSVATIAVAVVVAIVVLAIIGLVIFMKIRKFGPFKDKDAAGYGAQYTAGREITFDGLDSAGQRIFDLQNRQNAYAEQRLSGNGIEGAMGGPPQPLVTLDDDLILVLQDKNLLIERNWLAMGEIIGRGHFGCVYKGFVSLPDTKGETLVAVKTLHQNSPREIDVKAFIDEALRMKDFNHDNVLTLQGICFGVDDMPLVILPFMSHGDLLSYIRNESNNPTIKDLIMFGVDICKGMEYLAGLKFVHRDLACRNCMLDDDYRVKVADFGLSRDIYERDYYSSDNKKSKLPVKWMAPESLEKGNYNSKSDVWSFGVVLWELMTRGVNPYPEVDNWDVLRYIKSARRMPQPPYCPDALYGIMTKCWAFSPNDRPAFSFLVLEIAEMVKALQHQMKQGKETSDIQNTYVNVELCTDYHYADSPPVAKETSDSSQPSSPASPTSPTESTPITFVNSSQDEAAVGGMLQTDI